MPSSPVQALAHPLLTTMARARPLRRGQMTLRHQHRRGLGQVRREEARSRGGFIRGEHGQVQRSRLRLDAAVQGRGAEALGRGDAARRLLDRIVHAPTSAGRDAKMPSRMSTASSISAVSMVSGGSRRTTHVAVRLTSRPCSRACSRRRWRRSSARCRASGRRPASPPPPGGAAPACAGAARSARPPIGRDRAGPCPSAAPGRTPPRGTPAGCRRTCCRGRLRRSSWPRAPIRAPRRPARRIPAPCPPTRSRESTRAPGSRRGDPCGRGRFAPRPR